MADRIGFEARVRACLALAAMAAAGLFLWPVMRAPVDLLIAAGAYIDDAFFYSVIAERVAAGGAPSLDGIHVTNGFQPLWMALLVALKWALPGVGAFTLLVWAGYASLIAAAGLLTLWLLRDRSAAALVAAASVLALTVLDARFVGRVLNGLETTLLLAVLALWLLAARAALRAGAGMAAALWLAAVSCALFLTRTDLFWAPVLAALVVLRRQGVGRALLAHVALSALLVLPYLAWNKLKFGALVPISGRVKKFYLETQFPTLADYLQSAEWEGLFSLGAFLWGWWAIAVAALGLALLGLPGLRRRLPAELLLLAALALLHVLYLQLLHRELRPYTNYYFIPEALLMVLLLAEGLRAALGRVGASAAVAPRWAAWGFALGIVAYGAAVALAPPRAGVTWSGRVALAEAIGRAVPEGARVGAFWPGLFAHVSARPVVPLDGIISSPDYFETVLKRGRELDHALEIGVTHLAVMLPADFDFNAPMARAPDWPRLYLKRMADARHLRFEVVAEAPYNDRGSRWALVRMTRRAE